MPARESGLFYFAYAEKQGKKSKKAKNTGIERLLCKQPIKGKGCGVMTAKKWMVILAALVLAATAFFIFRQPRKEVFGVSVTRKSFTVQLSATGQLTTQSQQTVYAPIGGKVKSIYVQDGQRVNKGELLFALDAGTLTRELDTLQEKVESARVEVAAKNQEIARSRAELAILQAQTGFAEYGSLNEAMEEYLQQQKLTEAIQVSGSIVTETGAQIMEMEAKIQQLQEAVKSAAVYAPFSGEVVYINLDLNAYLPEATPVLKVFNEAAYRVDVALQENEYKRVKIGQNVIVNGKLAGTVAEKKNVLTQNSKGTLSGEARIDLTEKPDYPLLSKVAMNIVVGKADNVLAVPTLWLLQDEGGDYIFTEKGGRVQKSYVQQGLSQGKLTEITEGLLEGDTVLDPIQSVLQTGMKVKASLKSY